LDDKETELEAILQIQSGMPSEDDELSPLTLLVGDNIVETGPALPETNRTCPECNGKLTPIKEYDRLYCFDCERYN
jgi:hypothetical protein